MKTKPLFATILAVLMTVFGMLCAALGVDNVTFTMSPTPNVTHKLIWGTNAGGTVGSMTVFTNNFSLTNGPWGAYYFRMVAVSTNNIESNPSNEVLSTNRPAEPLQLRIVPGTNTVIIEGSFNGGSDWRQFAVASTVKTPTIMFRARLTNMPPLPGGVQ